jgi:hypothetical protein
MAYIVGKAGYPQPRGSICMSRAAAGKMPGAAPAATASDAALLATRTIMPVQHDEAPGAHDATHKPKRKTLSLSVRNLLMVAIGVVMFAIVAGVVLYNPIMYGDEIPNFGIILMLTVPVIAGVAFRVGLDAWLDRE